MHYRLGNTSGRKLIEQQYESYKGRNFAVIRFVAPQYQ